MRSVLGFTSPHTHSHFWSIDTIKTLHWQHLTWECSCIFMKVWLVQFIQQQTKMTNNSYSKRSTSLETRQMLLPFSFFFFFASPASKGCNKFSLVVQVGNNVASLCGDSTMPLFRSILKIYKQVNKHTNRRNSELSQSNLNAPNRVSNVQDLAC